LSQKIASEEVIKLVNAALDFERDQHGFKNDTELVKARNWRHATISEWRNGRNLGPVRILGPLICNVCGHKELAVHPTEAQP
jgi:hypothetical protein